MNCCKFSQAAILCSLLVTAAGCGGGSGLPEGVTSGTVGGTVTFSGSPIPEGCTVSFYPEGGTGIPAVSSTSADGSFRLRARGTFDIPTGIYKVVIQPPPPPVMSDEEAMKASVAGTLQTNEMKEVPQKYRAVDSTKELFEVKEGSNDARIDLKP